MTRVYHPHGATRERIARRFSGFPLNLNAANDLGSDVSERAWLMPGTEGKGTSHDTSNSRGGPDNHVAES